MWSDCNIQHSVSKDLENMYWDLHINQSFLTPAQLILYEAQICPEVECYSHMECMGLFVVL